MDKDNKLLILCMFPIKIPILFIMLVLLPFYTALDYAMSPYSEKKYSKYLKVNFNGLVRFLIT